MPPRLLAEPREVDRRRSRLRDPHIAPLADFARQIERQTGHQVPQFDPESGGVGSRVLILLQSPGRKASKHGSNFISPDNDDQTAENAWRLHEESGLARDIAIHWNIVPWYLGSSTHYEGPDDRDVDEAARWLKKLIGLLPELRVVLAVGRHAQRGWAEFVAKHTPDLITIPCPHPSPRNVNSRPEAWDEIVNCWRSAARVAQTN